MLLWKRGTITAIISDFSHKQIVEIRSATHGERLGINYPLLTGICNVGDEIVMNTTAVELDLGTGGFDFIIANLTNPPLDRKLTNEHIMKNRYTPLQFAVQSGEELDHAKQFLDYSTSTLDGTPVLIISLHSMLPLLTLIIKDIKPQSKVVYVMTDSTSLPIWLSDHAEELINMKLLSGTVTSGQSFGGTIEAINKFSGLLMAKKSLEADYIIIGPGPGSVGTGTEWGFSAIEVGEIVNAVSILSGVPIVVPRISFSDKRLRHHGLSHHLVTTLSKVTLTKALLPLPKFEDDRYHILHNQIVEANLYEKQQIQWLMPQSITQLKQQLCLYSRPIVTMGRGIDDDLSFFLGVSAAGQFALTI